MLPIGQAVTARSLLAGVFGRVRGFGPPGAPPTPVATSIAVSPNGASIGLAQTQQLNATILDQYGQPFSGTVSWSSSNEAVATVSTSGLVTPVAYGSVTITATFNALSTGVTLTVQQPTQLAITTQPSGAITGSAFSQQPVVRLRDAGNANVAESGRAVTAAIQSGTGTLTGTTVVNTDSNGVATFTNLTIDATSPPSNFALSFSATGLTGATSGSFTVDASSGGDPDPTQEINFESYASSAALRSAITGGTAPWFALDNNSSQISLITGVSIAGVSGITKAMRYTWPGTNGGAQDYTIRAIANPVPSGRELWMETWVRFSNGWRNGNTNGTTGLFDYKFMTILSNGGSRFNLQMLGVLGANTQWGFPGNEAAWTSSGNGTLGQLSEGAWTAADIWDGNWHRIRYHMRVSASGSDPTGIASFAVDDTVRHIGTGLQTTPSTGFSYFDFGANMNNAVNQSQTLDWARHRFWTSDPGWGF